MIRHAMMAMGISTAIAAQASAGVIANYSFTGNTNSTDSDVNTTASAITPSSTLTTAGALMASNNQSYMIRARYTPSTQNDAVTNNTYVSFTLTIAPGYAVDLTSLSLKLSQGNANFTSDVLPRLVTGSTTADLFASPAEITSANNAGIGSIYYSFSNAISGAATSNLTGTVEIRLYIWDNVTTTSDTIVTRLDDVVLSGNVKTVPEVASLGMLAAGAGLLIGRRRRLH